MSAYEQTERIITDTINEFGAKAAGLPEIIVDRIKDSGLKIEHRANATKKPAKPTSGNK